MKALSLWQPHAAAIALGMKPWETRSAAHWNTSYRGALAIHAAKRPWNDGGEWHLRAAVAIGGGCAEIARARFPEIDQEYLSRAAHALKECVLASGAVVCVVDLVDVVPTSRLRGQIPAAHEFWGDFSDGEDGQGRVAFKLENVRLLSRPLPWRGMQGFFEVDLGAEIEPAPLASELAQLGLFGGAL